MKQLRKRMYKRWYTFLCFVSLWYVVIDVSLWFVSQRQVNLHAERFINWLDKEEERTSGWGQ